MGDGGFIGGGYDVFEYWRAIQAAPNGTWIGLGDLEDHLIQWMKCDQCGAQMDAVLTQFHVCGEGL